MGLKFNGLEIPTSGNIIVDGQPMETVIFNGDVVWTAYEGPDSPLIITEDTTYEAGVDFPANRDIEVCCIGAGGSGAATTSNIYAGGGHQGRIVKAVVRLENGESIDAVIGTGGGTVSGGDRQGIQGGSTSFGTHVTALGGLGGRVNTSSGGYSGDGAYHFDPCDDASRRDGIKNSSSAWGGQWGAYGDGGYSWHFDPAGPGGIGAGGGGVSRSNGGGEPSGRGGPGIIVLRW